MLERVSSTALGTEHRTFGRLLNAAILSSSSPANIQIKLRPMATHRKLKPLFWQHGASAIEISSVWLSLAQDKLKDVPVVSPPVASFLYPRDGPDVVALQRTLQTGLKELSLRPTPRSNSSSVFGTRLLSVWARSTPTSRQLALRKVLVSSALLAPDYPLYSKMKDVETEPGNYTDGTYVEPIFQPAPPGQRPHYISPTMPPSQQIDLIIQHEDFSYSDLVWSLFKRLPPLQVSDLRLPVLLFFARCSSPAELDRMQYLISTTPLLEFNSELTTVAVRLYIRLRDISKAFQYFLQGLGRMSSPQPLEDLMIYSFWLQDWQLLVNIWQTWIRVRADTPKLAEVAKIPEFHVHLRSFMKYLGLVDRGEIPDDFSVVPDLPPKTSKNPSLGYIYGYSFEKKLADPRFMDLVRQLSINALRTNCPAWQSGPFLHVVGEPATYEEFLLKTVESGNFVHLSRSFDEYRRLDGYKPTVTLLRALLGAAKTIDSKRMVENIYHDWLVYHTYLPMRDLLEFMDFYARKGSPKAVNTLWFRHWRDKKNEITHALTGRKWQRTPQSLQPESSYERPERFTAAEGEVNDSSMALEYRVAFREYRILAYAYQGNVKRARSILDELIRFGQDIDPRIWEGLLKGFKLTNDYRGAIKVFMEIGTITKPSSSIFSQMISIAGSHGDIQYALDLFGQAKENGLENSQDILEKIVFAFCRSKKLGQARAVLEWAIESNTATVRMYNYLIWALGRENKLSEVEAIAELMGQNNVEWDSSTFIAYMEGFNKTRFPELAWKVFITAINSHTLIPTVHLVWAMMWGFNLTGQPWRSFELDKLMGAWDLEHNMHTLCLLTIARHNWLKMYKGNPTMTQIPPPVLEEEPSLILDFYREGLARCAKDPFAYDRIWSPNSTAHAYMVANALKALTSTRQWDDAHELLFLYQQATDHNKLSPIVLPPVMWMQYQSGDYAAVKTSWKRLFQSAVGLGQSSAQLVREQVDEAGAEAALPEPVIDFMDEPKNDGAVLPGSRYTLDGPFTTMRFVLTQEGDTRGLLHLVNSVMSYGFSLSRRNLNHSTQVLAQRGLHIPAFDLCEQHLIQGWSGWATLRRRSGGGRNLPLNIRWAGRNWFKVWSTSYTLVVLRNELNKLEEMEPWSSEAAATLEHVRENCKNVMGALTTWRYSGSMIEKELFGENELVRELNAKREEVARYEREEMEKIMQAEDEENRARGRFAEKRAASWAKERELMESLTLVDQRMREEEEEENEEAEGWEVVGEDELKEEKPQEEKPQEEKPQEEKPQEEKPQEEKPQEEKPQEEKPQEEKPQEEKLQEEKPQEKKPGGEVGS